MDSKSGKSVVSVGEFGNILTDNPCGFLHLLSYEEIQQLKNDIEGYKSVMEMPIDLQNRLMDYYMGSFEYDDFGGVMVSRIRLQSTKKNANEEEKYNAEIPLAKEVSSLGFLVYLFPENDRAVIYQRKVADGALGRAWLELKNASTRHSIQDAVKKGLSKSSVLFLNLKKFPLEEALRAINDQINGSNGSQKYNDKLIIIGMEGRMAFAVKTNNKGLEQAPTGGPRRITSLPNINDNIKHLFVNQTSSVSFNSDTNHGRLNSRGEKPC